MSARLLPRYYWYQAVSTATLFQAVFFVYYGERAGLSVATVLALQSFNTGLRAALDLPFGALADRVSRRLCLTGASFAVLAGAARAAGVAVAARGVPGGGAVRGGGGAALGRGLGVALRHPACRRPPRALSARRESRAGDGLARLGRRRRGGRRCSPASISRCRTWPRCSPRRPARRWRGRWTSGGRPSTSRPAARPHARRCGSPGAPRHPLDARRRRARGHRVARLLLPPAALPPCCGVPLALFGVVFAVTKLVTAVVAAAAHRIDAAARPARRRRRSWPRCRRAGSAPWRWCSGPRGALLILSRGLLDGLWMPLVNVYMNRLVESRVRATMLSLQSVLARLVLSATLAALGVATAQLGLGATLALAARWSRSPARRFCSCRREPPHRSRVAHARSNPSAALRPATSRRGDAKHPPRVAEMPEPERHSISRVPAHALDLRRRRGAVHPSIHDMPEGPMSQTPRRTDPFQRTSGQGSLLDSPRQDRRLGLRALRDGHALGILRAPAQGRSRPLLRGERLRPLLVGHALRGHRHGREEPRDLLVGAQHRGGGSRSRLPGGGRVHHDGRAAARRPPQGGPARRIAAQPDLPRAADPRARDRDPGAAAGRRDLRLGRPRLHRAHDGHAGDAVRLPLRGAPQAHVLVGHGHGSPEQVGAVAATEEERRAALMECLETFTGALEGARGQAPAGAHGLHHGARERRGDPRTRARWSISGR